MLVVDAALACVAHAVTVVVVAQAPHQTSAVTECDRVLLMHEGSVIEDGAPADLLTDAGSAFAELVRKDPRRKKNGADEDAARALTLRV